MRAERDKAPGRTARYRKSSDRACAAAWTFNGRCQTIAPLQQHHRATRITGPQTLMLMTVTLTSYCGSGVKSSLPPACSCGGYGSGAMVRA